MPASIKPLLIFIFGLFFLSAAAQKKKEIKKYGIRSVTSTKTSGTKTLKDEKLSYDASGRLTEEIKYNDDGSFLSDTRYKYNADDDVIEEASYDEKNVLQEKRIMKYNVLAQKTEERVLDKDGKQIRRFTYTYNAKGLRTEKKTYDANNTLVVTKKISYTFH